MNRHFHRPCSDDQSRSPLLPRIGRGASPKVQGSHCDDLHVSADEDSTGPGPQLGQIAAAPTAAADAETLSNTGAATSTPEGKNEATPKQAANTSPTPPAQPVTSNGQASGSREPRDAPIWLVPVGAIVLIAGAGKLGGVLWGAAALTLVVMIAVAVVVKTTFPEHRQRFAVAVGLLVGVALMFVLVAQRPDILAQLGVPAPSAPSSAVSPTATR